MLPNFLLLVMMIIIIFYRYQIKKKNNELTEMEEKCFNMYMQNRTRNISEEKGELPANYEQLEAYNEEITAMNEELDQSLQEINNLNIRLSEMIGIITDLSKSSYQEEPRFLSKILHTAIKIVPEADYGKIFLIEKGSCKFIDTIGHNISLLKDTKISQDFLLDVEEEGVYTSKMCSFDLEEIPERTRNVFLEALKSVRQSIYINITIDSETVGRISLEIAEDNNNKFSKTSEQLLRSFASLASAFFSFQRYNKLQGEFTKELIYSITHILEMHDEYTGGHSENVARLASDIAEKMQLSKEKIKDAYWAGMVHDIGKLLIPLNILNKKGSLTDKEYNEVKNHPRWGYQALGETEKLGQIANHLLYHHERWDGKGYPAGLKGTDIPVISQILGVVDAWDAMTSNRSYRDPLPESEAITELKDNKGEQFSPEVVDIFLEYIEELKCVNSQS